jgi:DNA-binding NarL/FixJ family response regulator
VEVLRLVAEGLTDAQVAARLFVSPHTVSTQRIGIYGEPGVAGRGTATRCAREHQLR